MQWADDSARPTPVASVEAIRRHVDGLLRRFAGTGTAAAVGFGGRIDASERALLDIFQYCGLNARGPIRGPRTDRQGEIDGAFDIAIDGVPLRIALEIKHHARPAAIHRAIEHARRIRHEGRYDRVLVIIASEIPEKLRRDVEGDGIGYIDLLGMAELRSWLWKHAPGLRTAEPVDEPTCAQIIREAMRAVAERLARAPTELAQIEWRDLERVLREVFEGMGFDTRLTRSGRDGGFDLSLDTIGPDGAETYLVEVKHWTVQRPGKSHLRKLVRVIARARATHGILLSSSGFAPSIYEGFTEAERNTVGIGASDKIVALCRTYYRLGHQLWTPETPISVQLLEGLV